MKKLIALSLSLLMIFTVTINSYAMESSYSSSDKEFSLKAKEGKLILQQHGFNDIEVIDNQDDGISYKLSLPNGTTAFAKVNTSSEGTEYEFVEGDKRDTICFCNDGKVIYNGEYVKDGETGEPLLLEMSVQTRARYSNYQKTPFKGKASDYNTLVNRYNKGQIEFGKVIKSLTATGLGTFFVELFSLTTTGGVGAGVMLILAEIVIENASTSAPSSKTLSSRKEIWEYVNAGTPLDHYYRIKTFAYPKANYSGPVATKSIYEYNYFS